MAQIDSSYDKAHRCARRKRGARTQAVGISRGDRTKVHALVDVLGALAPCADPGSTSDMKGADLLVGNTLGMKRQIGDRGYDANRLRSVLREQGAIPVIPVVGRQATNPL
jgi:hypothetical protein